MGIGATIAGIAGIHLLVGAYVYAQPLSEIMRAGLFASVSDFGDRATAFWFLVTALPLLVLGLCVREGERRGDPPLQALAPGLLLLSAAIVIPMPLSGGWAFLPVACWAWKRSAAARTPRVTLV